MRPRVFTTTDDALDELVRLGFRRVGHRTFVSRRGAYARITSAPYGEVVISWG
ncbi:hypothetical protein [Caulobacter phage S2B]|uniref:Uncharacterized protein n=1 Tax=Caulobacter phage S2B TaxID=2759120 RepID=A0AAE7ML99_9CAUD|nr:hypothetical protein [Caulobacter phage S2B]